MIVTAGKTADRRVIIMDPLTGRWKFPREHPGGLHPSAAGDAWIAHKVADILFAHGVRPASVSAHRAGDLRRRRRREQAVEGHRPGHVTHRP